MFKKMKARFGIELPTGLCANLTDEEFDTMINVSMGMEPLWENACGKNWKDTITPEKLRSLYEKM